MKTIETPTQTILEPLWDTWGRKKYAGAWDIAPACDFTSASPQEVNEWIATSLVDTLDAFSHLVRPGKMEFGAIYRDDVASITTCFIPSINHCWRKPSAAGKKELVLLLNSRDFREFISTVSRTNNRVATINRNLRVLRSYQWVLDCKD
ncbi:MAG: hypothetical protein GDA56_26520 [Hormoscilla sp. GM7CHS1pb]|nr:hypothetical protein [Hormoscilla sp. GM7CHS1pb]